MAQGPTDSRAGAKAAAGQSGLRAEFHLQLWSGASSLSSVQCSVNLRWSRHPWRVRSDTSIVCFTGEHLAEPLPALSACAASSPSLSSLLFTPLSHSDSVQQCRE